METDQVGRKLTVNIFKSQNLAGMNTTTITEKKTNGRLNDILISHS